MLNHNFKDRTTRYLLDLRSHLNQTLQAPRCASLLLPVSDTICQINAVLFERGIKPIKTKLCATSNT